MNYTVDNVTHFSKVFATLSYDPNAARHLHVQAGSFYWSDEMPPETDDGYPASIRHFMIYLLSYRMVLMYGEDIEEFRPLWEQLRCLCPSWPGFRPERSAPYLIPQLESEMDQELDFFERAIRVRERRAQHRRKMQERREAKNNTDAT